MAEPTDEELKALMQKMVQEVDHDKITVKKFIKLLSKEFGGISFSHKSQFIKESLTDILNSVDDQSGEEDDDDGGEASRPVSKTGGGLKAIKEISNDLAAFLGKGKFMARTEVVKEIWNYIRDNDLQNPDNRREILLDERMKQVFGVDKFTMFTLNKYVSAHIAPFKPVDLTTGSNPASSKKRKKGSPKKDRTKKTRKSGTQAPYQLSPELARVTGKHILPRPQVTKALWVYIRENNLQNPKDKREIFCDQNLKAVMGGNSKVTMFSMNKFITPHLLEKLDKSYYTHEAEDTQAGFSTSHRPWRSAAVPSMISRVAMLLCVERLHRLVYFIIMMLRLGLLRSWMERNAFVAALGVRPGGTSLLTEGRRTLRRLPTRHKTSFLSDGTNPGARLFSHKINQAETSPIEPSERPLPEPMSNLYCEWSVEQDRLLYDNRHESLPTLASLLGRGLKGVELRLEKLKDVNSPAYERLFSGLPDSSSSSDKKQFDSRGGKLVPSREVLRRIQYDVSLSMGDFTVLHYDRVDDTIVESPMDAPNDSIARPETQLLLALPEHRVVAVKYKERIVWDRETKVDRVFGSMGSNGETIDVVMATYDEWKRRKDATEEWNRQQQAAVSNRIRQMLGLELFTMLKHKSISLQETSADSAGVLQKNDVELYVQAALGFFRETRRDPGRSLEPTLIPMTDIDALYTFSELAALLPNAALRESILIEVSRLINRLEGKKCPSLENYQLPELDEDELVESFVRGSGAGGQKINKTSNRVVLIHEPTQVRVECQDTRSLQQNRKIARKRLRMKLDEYLNGTDSKASLKIQKAVQKKQRAKARTRARQARKNK